MICLALFYVFVNGCLVDARRYDNMIVILLLLLLSQSAVCCSKKFLGSLPSDCFQYDNAMMSLGDSVLLHDAAVSMMHTSLCY
jgi:hypothetical protein